MNSIKTYSKFIAIGGLSYWTPDMIVQLIHPPHYVWISLLTFLVPIISVSIGNHLSKKQPFNAHKASFPFFMLFGIWFFGPLAIAIGTIPAGGTFLTLDNIQSFLFLWATFPASTFMMSTYSGSLGGILLVTILLIAKTIAGLLTRPSKTVPLRSTGRS